MFSFVLTIISLSLLEFVGDSNFKFFARTDRPLYLMFGLLAYVAMVGVLVAALKQGNIIFTNGMWDGVSAILSTVLAYVLYKERLSNNYQWTGLAMVIAGCGLLGFGKVPK